jgi:hypothetical protein
MSTYTNADARRELQEQDERYEKWAEKNRLRPSKAAPCPRVVAGLRAS